MDIPTPSLKKISAVNNHLWSNSWPVKDSLIFGPASEILLPYPGIGMFRTLWLSIYDLGVASLSQPECLDETRLRSRCRIPRHRRLSQHQDEIRGVVLPWFLGWFRVLYCPQEFLPPVEGLMRVCTINVHLLVPGTFFAQKLRIIIGARLQKLACCLHF